MSTDEQDRVWVLGTMKRLSLKRFNNNTYIDIRLFWFPKGILSPTKKGLCLRGNEWEKLKDTIADIDNAIVKAIESKEESESLFELFRLRKVKVKKFQNRVYVDLRQYEMNQEAKIVPTPKGVTLTVEEWDKIKEILPEIEDEMTTLSIPYKCPEFL